jgi:excinuclease ABC subunit C
MVCFERGQAATKNYRRYRIKTVDGSDDFAMMREAVERRYQRLLDERARFPDLIVVDGGAGQVSAAHEVLTRLNLAHLPLIGLAKREEAIYRPEGDEPLRLERHSPALKLLQAIRDEAHRFANSFHQDLRSRRIQNSVLDDIPGVGKKRKQELLQAFGSVKNLRRYSSAEILKRLPRFGASLAETIRNYLQHPTPQE